MCVCVWILFNLYSLHSVKLFGKFVVFDDGRLFKDIKYKKEQIRKEVRGEASKNEYKSKEEGSEVLVR